MPDETIAVMLTNAVVPPATAERIAQWDGEAGREDDLIVCVGRLSPEKDQRTLIRAMKLLPPALPWRLAIVGDGAERAALEALARSYGVADRIVFTGQVADPFAWMMRARVAVCASVYEGLCNAIIEALACGTPVVSTDCPYGPARNPARRPLRHADAGRRCHGHGRGDRGGACMKFRTAARCRRAGSHYTAARAAERFLEIAADLQPLAGAGQRPACRGERREPGHAAAAPQRCSARAARHSRSKPFAMRNTAPLVSFTFDDVPDSAYTNGAAVLEQHGVRGTFYIATGTLGAADSHWRVIGRDQVRALHERGHEIGCHTFSHVGVDRLDARRAGRGVPAQPAKRCANCARASR